MDEKAKIRLTYERSKELAARSREDVEKLAAQVIVDGSINTDFEIPNVSPPQDHQELPGAEDNDQQN